MKDFTEIHLIGHHQACREIGRLLADQGLKVAEDAIKGLQAHLGAVESLKETQENPKE